EEAKKLLLERVEKEASDSLMSRLNKLNDEASEQIEEKSKNLMATAMERLASTFTAEMTTTVVDLPNDEMKGRIIGREGRNIKAIEQLTGVEIIVDDTPNAITISGFSGIRRQIAKRALDYLIKDGRIHPTKIEDAIERAKQELALDIKKAGEDALYELGITGFDTKLVQIIGRLKYRTSYGQNALKHSVEVAHLSGLLAEELGANAALAKKAGLLHDIGKAVDHEVKGTHPQIGGDIARKFSLSQEIIDPIETHHDDHPKGLMSVIVKVADAISSSRPGARNDSLDQYIQRLEELEKIANSFEGVDRSYAIQAGREIRIFVQPEEVNDLSAHELAVQIANKVEQELKYPGEIKINVIRELRVIEYAR
ncbi:MAG TPA: ribonuclease Y, partial [Patescibacteria group bacterium]|nr:ribonuclease Y [Patescibacteria group bacterium]